MVSDRKKTLPMAAGPGARRPNPGRMPLDMALRTIDEAAALGMEELQLSGGDPMLYPHLVEVISAARKHPGVFVLMNSVGTGVTAGRAREVIEAGLGAWNFSVDTLDPVLYERLRGVRGALPAIMEAIAVVREAGAKFPGFRFNYMTVITRHNFRGLPESPAHCVDAGAASVYLYQQVPVCGGCALRKICDGFHAQYAARWGGGEADPYPGPQVTDPRHFIRHQDKYQYPPGAPGSGPDPAGWSCTELAAPLGLAAGGGAVARHSLPAGQ
jgi:hypothetical protein